MNQPNPYAAPSSVIEDDLGHQQDPWGGAPIASRGTRLGAAMLDGVIFAGIGIVAAIVVPAFAGSMNSDTAGLLVMGLVLFLMLPLMGYNLYLLHKNGQTIGKKILNIKIVRSDRQTPASLGRIIGLRIVPVSLAGMIPFIGSFAGIIDVLFIFGEDQQCIHDMIADTIVVVDDGAYGGDDFDASSSSGPGLYGGDDFGSSGGGGGHTGSGFGSTGTDGSSSGGGQFGPGGDSGGSGGAGGPVSNDDVSW